jgi:hypothetical protein
LSVSEAGRTASIANIVTHHVANIGTTITATATANANATATNNNNNKNI